MSVVSAEPVQQPGTHDRSGSDMVLVELRPFPHQAGGHTAVLELNKSTICKPFDEREAWFYEHEPATLIEFTPKYLGQTEVTCDMCHDRLHLQASVPRVLAMERGLTLAGSSPSSPILTKRRGKKRSLNSDETTAGKSDVTSALEGWSLKCIERQISRYGFWANNQPQKFIMLENLVHAYRKPCLMDLKMGRRQFGDDSSAEKKQLLVERCAQSTSATLGFRISGSQVYDASTYQYGVRDKYVGRDLDNQGAINEIRHFFFNGIALRTDAIGHVIQKLERLKAALIDCTTLNFYSCSLLLIYEGLVDSLDGHGNDNDASVSNDLVLTCSDKNETGDKETENAARDVKSLIDVDVRLIDFAHVNEKTDVKSESTSVDVTSDGTDNTNVSSDFQEQTKVDDTIIYGIESLLEVLKRLLVQ